MWTLNRDLADATRRVQQQAKKKPLFRSNSYERKIVSLLEPTQEETALKGTCQRILMQTQGAGLKSIAFADYHGGDSDTERGSLERKQSARGT